MRQERAPKSAWGPGPWQDEPDHLEFRHEGFPCILHRAPLGHWCGYVGVPPGHPWHKKRDGEVEDMYAHGLAHGGLTYAEPCQGDVCHVPAPGEPDDVWWLGFDTAHSGDFSPACLAFGPQYKPDPRYETYKTIDYVRAETVRLAEIARKAAP